MEGARKLAKIAKTLFPEDKVYLTKEMVLRQNINTTRLANTKTAAKNPSIDKCKCGKRGGQCVGSLSCECNPIALCKRADKWSSNPLDDELSLPTPAKKVKNSVSPAETDEFEEDLELDDMDDGIEFEDDEYQSNPDDEEDYEDEEEDEENDEFEDDFEDDELEEFDEDS